MKKLLILFAVISASVFSSCTSTSDNPILPENNLADKIIGKWIVADGDGKSVVTNEKFVLNFVSPTKAYMSASFGHNPTAGMPWIRQSENDVVISGNKMTLTDKYDQTTTSVNVYTIRSINDKEFSATQKFSLMVNGIETLTKEYQVRYVKVNVDYTESILGKWQGRCTTENSVFDDGQDHQWEFKADGTYVYYVKDGGQWTYSSNAKNEYFVAGNLLCFRWIDNGQDNREWWEITIENGVMKWTAMRLKDDGNTYKVDFEMKKVE